MILSGDDFTNGGFPHMTARHTDLGWAPVLALRTGRTGEMAWEFHVPTEYVRDLYDKILDAGGPYGIRDIGYRALESLRVEKQYPAWGTDMRSDSAPFDIGLGARVPSGKPGLLAGPALAALVGSGPSHRLCWFTTDADVVMHGGEMLVCPAADYRAGVRSAGFGHTIGVTTFSAMFPADVEAGSGECEVEVMNHRYPATLLAEPLYDPGGVRVRS